MREVINEGLADFALFSAKSRIEAVIEASVCDAAPAEVIKVKLSNLMDWAEKVEQEACEDRMAAELN